MVFRAVNRFYVFLIGKRLYTVQNMGATLSSTVYITRAMCSFLLFLSFILFFFLFIRIFGWEEFGKVQDSDIFVYPEIKYGFISSRFSWNSREREIEGKYKIEMKCKTFPPRQVNK